MKQFTTLPTLDLVTLKYKNTVSQKTSYRDTELQI